MTSTNISDLSSDGPSPVMPSLPVAVDTKGRVRASKEQRRVILVEFERSGVSAAQFAKRTGLKYSTLAGWLKGQNHQKGQKGQTILLPDANRNWLGCKCLGFNWSRQESGITIAIWPLLRRPLRPRMTLIKRHGILTGLTGWTG
jgi:hypothetical protein